MTITANGQTYVPMVIYSYGRIEVTFQYLMRRGPFEPEAKRRELRERLNRIDGINISEKQITVRPPIALAMLSLEPQLNSFLQVMDWVVTELRTA